MKIPRILVIDDEPGFTRLLKLVLNRYHIREENDSGRAFETVLSFQPDLILMDVVMPEIDGGNLAAKIRADPRLSHIPIIFLTAVVAPSEEDAGPRIFGGFPFLAKPVSPDALERCIAQQLRTE